MKTWIKIAILVIFLIGGIFIGIGIGSEEKIVNPTTGNPTIDFLMTPQGLCSNNEIILTVINLIEAQQEVIKLYVLYPFPEFDNSLQLEVHDWCIKEM